MCATVSFTVAKRSKQPTCLLTHGFIDRMWYVLAMEQYSALKRKCILGHATTQMVLEDNMVSEISQTQKEKLYSCRNLRYQSCRKPTPRDPKENQKRNEWVFTRGHSVGKRRKIYGWIMAQLHSLMNIPSGIDGGSLEQLRKCANFMLCIFFSRIKICLMLTVTPDT